ncbi:MAG: type II toxin-antitoxin system VapC family toxin [Opitutaceae bacterium]|nr:type II toxin-antitoxin system VapC family toxin [Opitutaceae bacterium]
MLLDSSYLIDLEEELAERKFGPAIAFANAHRRSAPRISIITVGELAAGAADEAATRRFLSRYRVITLKPQIAYLAGRLERALSARGQRLGENDNWIAATALYYGEPIVTNDNDFTRVLRAGLPLKVLRY